MRDHIAPIFKKSSTRSLNCIRQVQSPVWVHHHLKLDLNLSPVDAIQESTKIVEQVLKEGQSAHNLVVAIDITCSPELISEGFAEQLAQLLLFTMDQLYPRLRDRFVGISDDENCLPLRDLLCTGVLAWEEIDNIHLYVFE